MKIGKPLYLWAVEDADREILPETIRLTEAESQAAYADPRGKVWGNCVIQDEVACQRYEMLVLRQVFADGVQQAPRPPKDATKKGRLQDMKFEYKGYTIQPKLDELGRAAWLVDGEEYKRGFVTVTKNGKNAMPGAIWFHSIPEARVGIDALIAAGNDADKFFSLYGFYQQLTTGDASALLPCANGEVPVPEEGVH